MDILLYTNESNIIIQNTTKSTFFQERIRCAYTLFISNCTTVGGFKSIFFWNLVHFQTFRYMLARYNHGTSWDTVQALEYSNPACGDYLGGGVTVCLFFSMYCHLFIITFSIQWKRIGQAICSYKVFSEKINCYLIVCQ